MNADRRLLDRALLHAVINVYGPWASRRTVPAAERSLARCRVDRARRGLAALEGAGPVPVVMPYRPAGEPAPLQGPAGKSGGM